MPKGQKFGGRQKGVSNKATTNAREAIAAFVDGNADRLTSWLDQIAVDSPKDAFSAFMSVVEYNIPKLARQEQTGADGGPVKHTFSWEPPK
jgi:hypothetical protein